MVKNMDLNFRLGQVALPIILLIGGILVTITISGTFINKFFSSGGLGERLSERAEAAAHAGVRDAILKISRDKEFTPNPNPYSLAVGNDNVSVLIERTAPNSYFYNYNIITEGIAFNRKKKLSAVIIVNQATGEVSLQSITEQAINN